MQQAVVSDNEDAYQEELVRLEEQLNAIPDDYQKEIVYAHYFNSSSDFFILSWDRDNDLLYCYSIINGRFECGNMRDQYLSDLASGHAGIQLDLHWKKKSIAQALHNRYSTYFPKPK